MITTKPGVVLRGLTPALTWILYALEEFHRLYKGEQPTDLVITSINDGNHAPNSRHYKNEALDLRSKNFSSRDAKRNFRDQFEKFLCKHPILLMYDAPEVRVGKFRVILENEGTDNEHFHIQVRKGMNFP